MSQENVEIVQCIYEAWNRSGGVPPLDFMDPAIETEFVGSLDSAGKYRGHAGLATALESFWGAFDNHRIEVEECVPVRDSVVVTVHYYGRGMASGVDVDLRGWQVWTLRDRKVVRWQTFGTRPEALEAVGLSEQDAHADS